jgi:hypothetical protein
VTDRPERIFATAATADQVDAGVGTVWWATHPPGGYALTVLDYQLDEMSSVNADWIGALFARSTELVTEHEPATRGCFVRVEHPGLADVLRRADAAFRDTAASRAYNRSAFDIQSIKDYEAAKWPLTLDERTDAIRPLVNSGKVVKLETGLRRFGFRAVRTNHLIGQIRRHRPGDAASAGELLNAFVLGVLLGTTPERASYFGPFPSARAAQSAPSSGPFGAYVQGRRPL